MKNFKKLTIWQKGMEIVTECYRLSKLLPDVEKFNFRSQITRSALSIPSNIAEGSSRSTPKAYKKFLEYALGSCFELETQILATVSTGLLTDDNTKNILSLIEEEQKMLHSFIKTVISNN